MQLIILGMHRSGTSSIAGFFQHCGVYFGAPEMAFDLHATNRKGFFERKDVVRINDRILESAGTSWITPERFPRTTPVRYEQHELFRDAIQVVSDLSTQPDWFVKDPRMCITLPFWKSLFSDPVYLLVVRNPLNVAKSLARRNDCSIQTGLALWERYTRDMFFHTKNGKRHVVSFEAIMADPVSELSRLLNDVFSLSGSAIAMPDRSIITTWFDQTLVHHEAQENELAEYATVSTVNLYRDVMQSCDRSVEIPEEASRSSRRLLLELEQFCFDRSENLERLKAWRNRLFLSAYSEQKRVRALRYDVEALLQSGRWKMLDSVFRTLGRPPSQVKHGYHPDGIRKQIETTITHLSRETELASHPNLLFPHPRYPQENPEIRTNPSSLRILLVSPPDIRCRTLLWLQQATHTLTSFGHEVNWLSFNESRRHQIDTMVWPVVDYQVNAERVDMIQNVLEQHDVLLSGPDRDPPPLVLRTGLSVQKPLVSFARDDLDIRFGVYYPITDIPRHDIGIQLGRDLIPAEQLQTLQESITAWKPNAQVVAFAVDFPPTSLTVDTCRRLGWELIEVGHDPVKVRHMAGMCNMHVVFHASDSAWISAAGVPVCVLDKNGPALADTLRVFLHHPEEQSGDHALNAMRQRHAIALRWQEIILALNDHLPVAPTP